jgi:hypothetical protein
MMAKHKPKNTVENIKSSKNLDLSNYIVETNSFESTNTLICQIQIDKKNYFVFLMRDSQKIEVSDLTGDVLF